MRDKYKVVVDTPEHRKEQELKTHLSEVRLQTWRCQAVFLSWSFFRQLHEANISPLPVTTDPSFNKMRILPLVVPMTRNAESLHDLTDQKGVLSYTIVVTKFISKISLSLIPAIINLNHGSVIWKVFNGFPLGSHSINSKIKFIRVPIIFICPLGTEGPDSLQLIVLS